MRTRAVGMLALSWLGWVGPALAQGVQPAVAVPPTPPAAERRDPGRTGAFDLSASVLWLAPSSLGSSDANLIANNTQGSNYRLFTASGDFQSAVGFEGRAGYHLTRMLAVEGGLTYSRPSVRVTIANDAEGAPGSTMDGETVSQFFLDASLVVYPMRRGPAGGRLRPFIEVGAGYLRELHGQSGATSGYFVKETGQVYHVGGGARYFFHTRPSGFLKAYGLRVDGRYYVRHGGFTFDGSNAKTFTAGAGLVLGF